MEWRCGWESRNQGIRTRGTERGGKSNRGETTNATKGGGGSQGEQENILSGGGGGASKKENVRKSSPAIYGSYFSTPVSWGEVVPRGSPRGSQVGVDVEKS